MAAFHKRLRSGIKYTDHARSLLLDRWEYSGIEGKLNISPDFVAGVLKNTIPHDASRRRARPARQLPFRRSHRRRRFPAC